MSKFDNNSVDEIKVTFYDLPDEAFTLTMDDTIVDNGDLCVWKAPTGKATFFFEALDDIISYQENAEIFLGITINIKKINKRQFLPNSLIFWKAFNKTSVFVERV